jgi:uncharacterized protein (TIGR02265 family)
MLPLTGPRGQERTQRSRYHLGSLPVVHERLTTVDLKRARATLDLDSRLRLLPAQASVRGFYFKQTADEVARHGPGAVAAHRRLSPVKSKWFFRMYPIGEYLEDLASAAAVLSPEDPPSAVRAIWANGPRYAPLFNATRFLGLLRGEVASAMQWLEAHRGVFANYGRWRLERLEQRYVIMHYFDECIWIDSAHRGGMEGLLQACGVEGTVEVELDSPLDGHLHVRWQAP